VRTFFKICGLQPNRDIKPKSCCDLFETRLVAVTDFYIIIDVFVCFISYLKFIFLLPAANLVALAAGCVLAWTSSAEAFLKESEKNPGGIPKETWTWVAGLTPLGAALGPIPTGFLTDKFGRKPCLYGVAIFYIISWIMIGFQNGANILLAARFIGGLATGALFTVLPMYIGEISAVR